MKKKLFLVVVVLFSLISHATFSSNFENRHSDYTLSLFDFLVNRGLLNLSINSVKTYKVSNFEIAKQLKLSKKPNPNFKKEKKSVLTNFTSLPVGNNFQIYSGTKTLADLNVVGSNLKWYDISNIELSNTTELTDETTYKVTQTINEEESESLFVTVKKISESVQNYCVGATTSSLISNPSLNSFINWFANPTGGSVLESSEVLNSTTYYAEQITSQTPIILGSGLNYAQALTINASGEFFIGQNNSPIIKMDSNGNIVGSFGTNFNYPENIILDSFGNIFVANTGDNLIQKIDNATNTVTTIANINAPKGIALDNLGNLFVTGNDNYDYIVKMDSNGNNSMNIGSGFYFPQGVAVDALGNVYVADTYNQVVKKMDANGENINVIGSGFNYPRKIKFDSLGNIYVLDSDGIKKMDSNGNNIQIINTGSTSLQDFTIDELGNVIATNDTSLIKKPISQLSNRVAVSVNISTPPSATNSQIFIEGNTLSNLIVDGANLKWYNSFGELIPNSTLLIDESIYGVSQTINEEESCKINITVNLISEAQQSVCEGSTVSDLLSTPSLNSTVSWFNAAIGGDALSNSSVLTNNTYYAQQGTFSSPINIGEGLNFPQAITADTSGNIYVLDYNTIKKMNANGNLIATISLGFDSPKGIAVDAAGTIYVADTVNNRIVKMDANGNNSTVLGYGFYLPTSIALDNVGNIFVLQNNSIVKMDSSGNNLETIANNSLNFPLRLTLDSTGNIYVIENFTNFIKKIDNNGNFLGYIDAGYNFLIDIDIDSFGNIYLLTEYNGVVKIDSNSNNGFAFNVESNNLKGLVVDITGNIFVTNDYTLLKTTPINSNRVPVSVTISSPEFTQVAPIISGQTLLPLPTISDNNIAGKWSPELNNFETTTYTFTPNFGNCETTMTIVVNSNVPTFTQVEDICLGESLESLPTISTNGIEGTWSPEMNNMETTTYTFTPNSTEILPVTMTIVVNIPLFNSTTVLACDSYTWENNGETYTTSGTYIGTTTNCITEELILIISNSTSYTETITACESYTWEVATGNGLTYTESQTGITNITIDEAGCEHTEILNLTIIPRPDAPIVACYQTAIFNSETCQWDVEGEQPLQPTELACYQMAIFNTETCQWDIEGEEPAQPTELECYESVGEFNSTTCQWDIVGEQPLEPEPMNCWDEFVFDSGENCSWINIGIQPNTPTTQETQTFTPGATVSNLVAVGSNLNWYNLANGGNALESNSLITPGTYYVSQAINGCESQRVSVGVSLFSVLCSGATVADLVVSRGINVRWYTSLSATTSLSSTTQLSSRVYYFTQTIEGIQTTKIPVSVTIDLISNATSISGAFGTICYNSTKILSLNSPNVRGDIQWQSSAVQTGPFTPIAGANATTLNTVNLTTTTYYNAVVTNGVCPSKTTATVTVTVRPQSNAGTINGGGAAAVCAGTNKTVLTLSGHVGTIIWQSSTNNVDFETIIPNITATSLTATNLSATTYYRVIVTNSTGCTSATSNSVVVTVNPIPESGIITGTSSIQYNTKATLVLNGFEAGSFLQWKYGQTLSGTYFNGGQANNTSNTYTSAKLIRDYYYKVTVTKDGCSSTTAPFLVDVSSAVKIEANESITPFEVKAYPNPSSSEFTIETSAKGAMNVKVYDMQGRFLETATTNKVGSKLAAGTYNVIVNQGANTKSVRVIKQ